jgi:coatomer subunit beta
VSHAPADIPPIPHLKKALEDPNVETKIDALKKVILLMLSGEPATQLLMPIIRFVLPSKDRTIKKLLMLYWEVVDKKAADGKLLNEMILVCNALMRDLNHPNEYIRGSTMRLVGKLKEPELVEPLVESLKNNLTQRHLYVRRNAVLAIYSVYKDMPQLIPDAGEIIMDYLEKETDASCKRNAFLMLFNTHPDKALAYLMSVMDQVATFGEVLQLIVLEMIRRVSRSGGVGTEGVGVVPLGARRMAFIRVIFTLLASSVKSQAVQYEAAVTLLSLSRAPTAIKAASQALMHILAQSSDNNIKLVVLDKINDIKIRHAKVIQEQVMDILRVLSFNPHLDIVKKTLAIALDLITPKNIQEVISLLKKEITKSQSEEFEKGGEYRQVLVQAIRNAAIRYPDIAAEVVLQLLEFLGDSNPNAAQDVVLFVREVVHRYPHLRATIIQAILDNYFDNITSPLVFTPVLWLIGEYADSSESVLRLAAAKVSELLIGHVEYGVIEGRNVEASSQVATNQGEKVAAKPVLLADGSYASTSALMPGHANSNVVPSQSLVLASIVKGGALAAADYFLASAAATTLTKLALRARALNIPSANRFAAKVLLVLVRFVRLRNQNSTPAILEKASTGSSASAASLNLNVAAAASIATPLANSSATAAMAVVDPDSQDWFFTCIQLLTNPHHAELARDIFLNKTQRAFSTMMEYQQLQKENPEAAAALLASTSASATALGPSNSASASETLEIAAAGAPGAKLTPQQTKERNSIRDGSATQADSLIRFGLLRDRRAGMGGIYDDVAGAGAGGDEEMEDSIFNVHQESSIASPGSGLVGSRPGVGSVGSNDLNARMNRVTQLTGLSDPLYVEAVLVVHQYDISLEITIINQTPDTLSNLTLELGTLGELKLVERPTPYNLAANGKLVVTHHVSINSTETGTIFGAIVYDVTGSNALTGNTVVLNEIHIDMIDYIQPAACDDASFRSMWQSFEWDTKVSVSAESSLADFLSHILNITNMHCLTPISSAIDQSCGFLAANLYAKSKFGEDALANLSIQRVQGNPGRIQGFIRIRAETRGVADSLHAKILQRMKV